jgi:hypothetical protein
MTKFDALDVASEHSICMRPPLVTELKGGMIQKSPPSKLIAITVWLLAALPVALPTSQPALAITASEATEIGIDSYILPIPFSIYGNNRAILNQRG